MLRWFLWSLVWTIMQKLAAAKEKAENSKKGINDTEVFQYVV